jgi:hypothetical protein
MFDVDEAVRRWREGIAANESIGSGDIEEMEGHLTDEMGALAKVGLSEEEAFLVAVRRIGQADALAAEFAKVNGGLIWRQRFFWMAMGLFVFVAVSAAGALARESATAGAVLSGMRGAWAGVIGPAVQGAVVVTGLLLVARGIRSGRLEQIVSGKASGATIAVIAGFAVLFRMAEHVVPVVTYRVLSMEEAGAMALPGQAISLGWPVLMPVAIGVIVVLMRGRRQEAAGSR